MYIVYISIQMMVAAVRAFAKKDDLTTQEQKKAFKIQFQLNEKTMKKMETDFKKIQKGKSTEMEFAKNYKISFEDIEELRNEFKITGQEVLTKQLVKKSDTKFLELIKNFDQEKNKFFDNELKMKVGRKAFMEKYKLNKGEPSELDVLIQKYAKEGIQFDKTLSLVVVFMSHGKDGKILGISLVLFQNLKKRNPWIQF